MTDKNYWVEFHKNKKGLNSPWNHPGEKLLNFLFKKYDFPKSGNVLDVGTGTGSKAITLANMGFGVWAFDVTKEAFEEAQRNHREINFFVSDAAAIGEAKEIKDVKFDIIFDLLVTQFISKEEKEKYLAALQNHLKPNSYYILQTFYKGEGVEPSEIPWVNKVSQSREDIEEIYGKYFKIIDLTTKDGGKGTDAFVVMINQSQPKL